MNVPQAIAHFRRGLREMEFLLLVFERQHDELCTLRAALGSAKGPDALPPIVEHDDPAGALAALFEQQRALMAALAVESPKAAEVERARDAYEQSGMAGRESDRI